MRSPGFTVVCDHQVSDIAHGLQEEYERPRQQANISMTAALDGLKRVFEPQTGLTARIRSIGLGLLNDVPFAKDKIMQYAMGR